MKSKSSIHFEISERKLLLRLIDGGIILLVLYFVGQIFKFNYFYFTKDQWVWSVVLLIYYYIFATIFEMYDLQKSSRIEKIIQATMLTTSITILFYLLTPRFTPSLPNNRLQIVYFYLAITLGIIVWRYAYISLIAAPRFYKRVLIICNADELSEKLISLQKSDPNYKVVGYINAGKSLMKLELDNEVEEFYENDLFSIIASQNISEVVVATPDAEGITVSLYNQLIALLESGVSVREYTQVFEEITNSIPLQSFTKDFYRNFPFSRSNQNKLYLFFHRLLDLVLSLLGLLLGLVLTPFIFIGNLLGNQGPFFYTQTRVGRNGRHFKIYKLRSMVVDAEKEGAQWTTKKDVRVTKFGKFLRRSRFDEIPQFINVIKGDMSVIGPRPERPEFVKELAQKIPFYEIRHIVKPGVTGWAQVNEKYGASEEDALKKLQYDLYYIKRRSLFLDLSIVLKTLSTIIFFRGQ